MATEDKEVFRQMDSMIDIETRAILLLQGSPARKGIPINYDISRAHAIEALCRAIEQHEATKQEHAARLIVMHSITAKTEAEHEAFRQEHEAFKQKVSDVVEEYIESFSPPTWHRLEGLIIPKPKPDPLVQAVSEANAAGGEMTGQWIADFRTALDALGFEIREKNDG